MISRLLIPHVAGAAIANRAFPRLLSLRFRKAAPEPTLALSLVELERVLTHCHPLLDGVLAFPVAQHRLVVVGEVSRQFHRIWEEDLTGELNPLFTELKSAIRQKVIEHGGSPAEIILLQANGLPTHADRHAAREECRLAYLEGALPSVA